MKAHVEDFAILGGPAAFAEPLHVGRPNVGNRERLLARINDALDRRRLTNSGPLVEELEAQLARFLDVPHCVVMSNGTAALEVLIRALGLSGEVIVPSLTFVATAHALLWLGLQPVFCDVDPQTHNLDPVQVARLITPRTSAILGVHLWGRPCAVDALSALAERHGLHLLFDAAHAFGNRHANRPIGGFGSAEVFSFHATKFFNTLEGGAVTTRDDGLAQRLRLMRNFGFRDFDDVVDVGTNAKLNELGAAMGLTLLEEIDDLLAVNRRNYAAYAAGLAGVPGVTLTPYAPATAANHQYVVLEVDAATLGLSRDELVQLLWAENVLARRYFYPGCHRMEPYRTLLPDVGARLPQTERLTERLLCLPTGGGVSAETATTITNLIRRAAALQPALRDRLDARHAPTR